MAFTLAQLATEINTDPTSLGLVALKNAGSDQAIADALNLRRGGITVDRNDITAREAMGAVLTSEYLALDTSHQNLWQALLLCAPLDATNSQLKSTVGTIFGVSTTTRANLQALASRSGSRAEQLWGTGALVSALDVSRALARPGVQ